MSISEGTRRDLILDASREENKDRDSLKNADDQELFCKYWVNDTSFKPKALVFIAHGYAEHCLRYTQLAHALIQHGLYPFAHDHVGHGQSEGREVLVDEFDIYVRDVIQHINMVKDRFPNIPVYAIGHSMGGCIVLRMCLKEPKLIEKAALIGPAVLPFKKVDNFCVRNFVRIMGYLFPEFKLEPKIREDMLTWNVQQMALIKADPLIYHGGMKAGLIKTFFHAVSDLERNLHRITLPLLILHGEQDAIVTPDNSQVLYEKASSKDKTLKIYPELLHQLHAEKEPDSDAIRQEMCQWLIKELK